MIARALRWDDVDRTWRVLRLRDGKTGPRMVPLTDPVLAVLDGIERMEGVPWVIRNKSDGRLTGLFSYWQHIRKDAGLDDVRVHDLSHSCASWCTNILFLLSLFYSVQIRNHIVT